MSTRHKTRAPRRRRRYKDFISIPFAQSFAITNIGDGVVITGNVLASNFGEDIFIVPMDWTASLRAHTANENPITFGVAHSDLSVGEISEALEAEVTSPDDIIAKERARRPVRRFGTFSKGTVTEETVNDGITKRNKVMMSIGNGFNLAWWVRNQSGAILTTGSFMEYQGTLFGRWQR